MAAGRLDALTGAFGFTGRAIAERLLADGREIVTLSPRECFLPHPELRDSSEVLGLHSGGSAGGMPEARHARPRPGSS